MEYEPRVINTWGQAVEFTLRTRWKSCNSRQTNIINCNHVTNQLGNSYPLKKITPFVMNQVVMDLEVERGMSSSTQNRVISAVSTVLNYCLRMGVIDFPVPKFERKKEGEHRLTWFSKQEVGTMCCAAVDPFDRADVADIIATAAYTGLRQGELMNLKAEDVDLGTRRLYVGGREGFETKTKGFRCLPIHETIYPILKRRAEHTGYSKYIFRDDWHGGKDQLLRAFKKVRNYSIHRDDRWTFHSLRHSFATWCAESGVPMRTLMGLMGHSNIETTLRYAKVTDDAMTNAIDSL